MSELRPDDMAFLTFFDCSASGYTEKRSAVRLSEIVSVWEESSVARGVRRCHINTIHGTNITTAEDLTTILERIKQAYAEIGSMTQTHNTHEKPPISPQD